MSGEKDTCVPDEEQDDGLIPLVPLDEKEEARRRETIDKLLQTQHDLIAEMTGELPVPLEHRENLTSADLEHFVVNYCLDLAAGRDERAKMHVESLRQFPPVASSAVEDFLSGKSKEPALGPIPSKTLEKWLKRLLKELETES